MSRDPRVISLDHVSVTTPGELEQDVVAWYRDCLGLAELAKPEGTRGPGAWFEAGSAQVHVSVDPHNPSKSAHFGLEVADERALIQRLRAAGNHIEQASGIAGRRRFFTRDPAGNRVEIVCYT